MKNTILRLLKKTDHLPMLFVGSGMSIRYLGLENWKGLLRKFARLATDNEYAYEMYEQQAKGLECKDGLLPKVAELIERDFNVRWFRDEQFRESREQSADEISRSVSPLKIEIARHMPHGAVGVKVVAVPRGDTGRFLPAVLQRVQAERGDRRRTVGPIDADDAAFFVQVIVLPRIGGQHVHGKRASSAPRLGGI